MAKTPRSVPDRTEGDEEQVGAKLGANLTRETFEEHWRKIRTLKRELDEANGLYRAAKKLAEGAGVDLKTLGLLEQLAKLDDGEADSRLNKLFRYAGWLDLPIGTQIDLFQAEPRKEKADAEHSEWAATEAGIESGKHGANRDDNPFVPGSPLHVKWDGGWLRGQEIIAKGLAPKPKQASTRRERREPGQSGGPAARPRQGEHAAGLA